MSLRDELGVAEPSAAEVQKAYDEAGRYEFMGRRLEPWTVRRHSVALQLGSRIMRGMDDEERSVSNFLAEGFYTHIFHDLVIVLYLLHLDKSDVVRLEQLPETKAMERAYDWAESIPLNYGSQAFFDGAKIIARILHSIRVSWFQAAKKESDDSNGEKKISSAVTDQPGSLNSASAQSAQAVTEPITS